MYHSKVTYIAVDFDGTIVEHMYPHIGKPNPGAIEWMKMWADQGVKILLHTMRDDEELIAAVEYLKDNEVPLYGVNVNPDQLDWTDSTKTHADIYIDDLAHGVPLHHPKDFSRVAVDWSKVGPEVYAKILGVDNVVQ